MRSMWQFPDHARAVAPRVSNPARLGSNRRFWHAWFPMSSSAPDLLSIAHSLADAAAAQSMRHFRTPLDIITKADESPVTLADRAAETAMREILAVRAA